ncbi:MAG: hypothetical protein K2M34_02150 [Alphaproteobacteria bacterium]|nr:hypothetical protein [Alphaproteobacteria bacterium]
MTKTVLFSVLAIMTALPANAGLLDGLFGKKDAEPKTLEEACNKDEITALCPEVILGTKTIQECLIENVSGVSKKCANYVKKSVADQADNVKQKIAGAKEGAESMTAEQKQEIAAKKAAAKTAKADLKKSLKETKEAARAVFDAEREQIKAAAVQTQDAK